MKRIYSLLFLVSFIYNAKSQTPCSGTPANNTIIVTSTICSGSQGILSLLNSYTSSGITYQWQYSTTSSIGPFIAIPGATNVTAAVTPTVTTWYNVIITCSNSTNSVVLSSVQISTQPLITNTIPYYEGFSGLTANNQLPNCSWSAQTLGSTALTFSANNGMAAFYYSPAGAKYFYSNGLQLNAGVTYSSSLWWTTNNTNSVSWTDLTMFVGTSQSTTGLVTIASTNGNALNQVFTLMSNTFTVPNSGIYYIAIRGTSNGGGTAMHLTWDDLMVTVPCQVSPNAPTVSISPASATVCQGQPMPVLTASGAHTYSWSNGATTSTVIAYTSGFLTPLQQISVIGTNTLSGCAKSASVHLVVNPSPNIFLISNHSAVCAFTSVTLTAFGATSYSWSQSGNTNTFSPIVVTPSVTTTYTVVGTNAYGCSNQAIVTVSVNPLPVISVQGSQTVCAGETVNLSGQGAPFYSWLSSSGVTYNNPLQVISTSNSVYYLTGTDMNGCKSTMSVEVIANACTGVSKNERIVEEMYPNPTSGIIYFKTHVTGEIAVMIFDLSGRIVGFTNLTERSIDLSGYDPGIYYLQLSTKDHSTIIKVVKE